MNYVKVHRWLLSTENLEEAQRRKLQKTSTSTLQWLSLREKNQEQCKLVWCGPRYREGKPDLWIFTSLNKNTKRKNSVVLRIGNKKVVGRYNPEFITEVLRSLNHFITIIYIRYIYDDQLINVVTKLLT